ncbi:hypothetical protein B0H12DRAFT_1078990 [Mycena haematopus]|nr:hypothetical protein B0H12DRAFT_1078990 [Mycena haematopus]
MSLPAGPPPTEEIENSTSELHRHDLNAGTDGTHIVRVAPSNPSVAQLGSGPSATGSSRGYHDRLCQSTFRWNLPSHPGEAVEHTWASLNHGALDGGGAECG